MDYERFLNNKVKQIKPSGIRKFFDVVSEMPDTVSLGVGEPDFATPFSAAAAAVRSINAGRTQYSSNAGMPKLKEAICQYQKNRFGLDYQANEVLVTIGASEAIDLVFRAVLNDGDEVLVPEPSYVSYAPCVTLSSGIAVPLECRAENGFRLDADALKRAITPKTKALVLPYPNNPTGAILEKEELLALAEVLKDKDILVVSDEIYAELTYGGRHCSIASIEGMREKTVVINGFSKAFAMTGWRLGYLLAPVDIVRALTKIHQYTIMCAPTMSQYAGLEAIAEGLEDDFETIRSMREQYDMRRRYLVASLNSMGLTCFEPRGAFYVFPNVSSTGMNGEEFAERLLREGKVAVVPGSAFGNVGGDFVRISYAYSMKQLGIALGRIKGFLDSL